MGKFAGATGARNLADFNIKHHIFCRWLHELFMYNMQDAQFSDPRHFFSYEGY